MFRVKLAYVTDELGNSQRVPANEFERETLALGSCPDCFTCDWVDPGGQTRVVSCRNCGSGFIVGEKAA